MVCREFKHDQRSIIIKQGMRGTFEVLVFEEFGKIIGAITMELVSFLSKVLHEAVELGYSGKNYWSSSDLMFWLKVHRRTSKEGLILQITWSKKLRNNPKFLLEIRGGKDFLGWKKFAICLDSLNPLTKNLGEEIFPCANFAGKSRAYNDVLNHPTTTWVDALGQGDILGAWKAGLVLSKPSLAISWLELGNTLMKETNLSPPVNLLPIDDFNATLFVDSEACWNALLRKGEFLINNWTIKISSWKPTLHKQPALSINGVFWISLHGVPLHLWTLDVIKCLTAHCGEFLVIAESTLALQDSTAIRVKVRNRKGSNSIPRTLNLKAPEGDYEIQVNIIPTGCSVSSPNHGRISITEEDDAELAVVLAGLTDVEQSEATISESWQARDVRKYPTYKDVLLSFTSDNNATDIPRQSRVAGSYTTQTHSYVRTWKKRHRRGKGQRRRKKKEFLKKSRERRTTWRWVPKVNAVTVLGANQSISISNSNSNLNSLSHDVPSETNCVAPSASSFCNEAVSAEGTIDTQAIQKYSSDSNNDSPAQRHLRIGMMVGMTCRNNDSQVLALIEKNISKDLKAREAYKSKHKNPDLEVELGDLVAAEGINSDEEDDSNSIITPIAPFVIAELDPIEAWSNSLIQAELSGDSCSSIPPGFRDPSMTSLRSLKASIKNHYRDRGKSKQVSTLAICQSSKDH